MKPKVIFLPRVRGMGAASCANTDPLYPGGCPAGFVAQPTFTCPPNFDVACAASSPGAKAFFDTAGCVSWQCLDPNFKNPFELQSTAKFSNCNQQSLMVLAGGALALILLPGWSKLLALAAVPLAFEVGLCGQSL